MKQLGRHCVILSIAGFLLTSGILGGQSRDELRRKYGEPSSETFMVRPDISVTATYAKNGEITELLIAPRITGFIKSRERTLSQDSAKAILDELVPRSVRGKFVIGGSINMLCLPENDCAGTSANYEKIEIYYNAAAEGRIHYVVVQWKEPSRQ